MSDLGPVGFGSSTDCSSKPWPACFDMDSLEQPGPGWLAVEVAAAAAAVVAEEAAAVAVAENGSAAETDGDGVAAAGGLGLAEHSAKPL